MQEQVVCTRQGDLQTAVEIIDILHQGTGCFALAVMVCRDLLVARQYEFILLFVEQQCLPFPGLIHFGCDNGSDTILIFGTNTVFLQFKYLGCQGLTQIQNGTTAELREVDFVGHLFTQFAIGINFASLCQRDLQIAVFQILVSHYGTVSPNFEISFFRVDNHVIVLICTEHTCDHVAEGVFQHADHRLFVDILQFLELRKAINHTDFLFLGHNLYLNLISYFVYFISSNG